RPVPQRRSCSPGFSLILVGAAGPPASCPRRRRRLFVAFGSGRPGGGPVRGGLRVFGAALRGLGVLRPVGAGVLRPVGRGTLLALVVVPGRGTVPVRGVRSRAGARGSGASPTGVPRSGVPAVPAAGGGVGVGHLAAGLPA